MKTKIFCDSADYKIIKSFNKKSFVDGFTTNPSLMRLSGAKNYKDYSLKILKVCKKKPISFEVFADNPSEMLNQAYKINKWGRNVYVKIPVVNSEGVFMGPVIKKLSNQGDTHVQCNRTFVSTHVHICLHDAHVHLYFCITHMCNPRCSKQIQEVRGSEQTGQDPQF